MWPRAQASTVNTPGAGCPVSRGWMRLFFATSASTAVSVARRMSVPSSSRSMTSRP